MIEEDFDGFRITASPLRNPDGRWSACVRIRRIGENRSAERVFRDEGKVSFVLEAEAAKESITLGKNLVRRNLVGR